MFKELRKVGVLTNKFPIGKQVIEWYCVKYRKEVKRENIKCPHCGYDLIDLEDDNRDRRYKLCLMIC